MVNYKQARVEVKYGNKILFEGKGILPVPLVFSIVLTPEEGNEVTKEIIHYSGNDKEGIESIGNLIRAQLVDREFYRGNVLVRGINGLAKSKILESLVDGLHDTGYNRIIPRLEVEQE